DAGTPANDVGLGDVAASEDSAEGAPPDADGTDASEDASDGAPSVDGHADAAPDATVDASETGAPEAGAPETGPPEAGAKEAGADGSKSDAGVCDPLAPFGDPVRLPLNDHLQQLWGTRLTSDQMTMFFTSLGHEYVVKRSSLTDDFANPVLLTSIDASGNGT